MSGRRKVTLHGGNAKFETNKPAAKGTVFDRLGADRSAEAGRKVRHSSPTHHKKSKPKTTVAAAAAAVVVKTPDIETCRMWEMTGDCPYGSNCKNAHPERGQQTGPFFSDGDELSGLERVINVDLDTRPAAGDAHWKGRTRIVSNDENAVRSVSERSRSPSVQKRKHYPSTEEEEAAEGRRKFGDSKRRTSLDDHPDAKRRRSHVYDERGNGPSRSDSSKHGSSKPPGSSLDHVDQYKGERLARTISTKSHRSEDSSSRAHSDHRSSLSEHHRDSYGASRSADTASYGTHSSSTRSSHGVSSSSNRSDSQFERTSYRADKSSTEHSSRPSHSEHSDRHSRNDPSHHRSRRDDHEVFRGQERPPPATGSSSSSRHHERERFDSRSERPDHSRDRSDSAKEHFDTGRGRSESTRERSGYGRDQSEARRGNRPPSSHERERTRDHSRIRHERSSHTELSRRDESSRHTQSSISSRRSSGDNREHSKRAEKTDEQNQSEAVRHSKSPAVAADDSKVKSRKRKRHSTNTNISSPDPVGEASEPLNTPPEVLDIKTEEAVRPEAEGVVTASVSKEDTFSEGLKSASLAVSDDQEPSNPSPLAASPATADQRDDASVDERDGGEVELIQPLDGNEVADAAGMADDAVSDTISVIPDSPLTDFAESVPDSNTDASRTSSSESVIRKRVLKAVVVEKLKKSVVVRMLQSMPPQPALTVKDSDMFDDFSDSSWPDSQDDARSVKDDEEDSRPRSPLFEDWSGDEADELLSLLHADRPLYVDDEDAACGVSVAAAPSGSASNAPAVSLYEDMDTMSDDDEGLNAILQAEDTAVVTKDDIATDNELPTGSKSVEDVDWSVLAQERQQQSVAPESSLDSCLKRFTAESIFQSCGISKSLAGESLFGRVCRVVKSQTGTSVVEDENSDGCLGAMMLSRLQFAHRPTQELSLQLQRVDGFALTARKDLALRRHLKVANFSKAVINQTASAIPGDGAYLRPSLDLYHRRSIANTGGAVKPEIVPSVVGSILVT